MYLLCGEAVGMLDRYIMDRLPPDERARVQAHLSVCATCSRIVTETGTLIAAHLRAAAATAWR
jgi:anti-sigma factor RsiW